MSTDPTPTPVTELTAEEVTESLTGFDEIAIEKMFGGFDPYTGGEKKPMTLMRSLIFVMQRRGGDKDPAAKAYAMALPVSEVNGYFTESEDEADPEDPDTESGKGD